MPDRSRVGIYLRSQASDGGVFQYATTVLRALSRLPADRWEVVAAYTQQDMEPYVRASGVEAHHIDLSRTWENWTGLVSSVLAAAGLPIRAIRVAGRLEPLVRQLGRIDCDLWVFPAGDSVIYRANLHSIAMIHDLMHRYESRFPEVGRWTIRTRRELHYRALCASADLLVADSSLGARHIAESYGVDSTRIAVLPFAAPDYLDGAPHDRMVLPDLPERFFYYPARFWPHKNHLNLARAVRVLVDRGLDPYVVLSGGGTGSRQVFRDEVDRLGIADRFVDLGYVANDLVAALYRQSVGLVYPSFFGPTNIPPLEALLCETAMAVSDNYAMREQLSDAALYFDPDSPISIAEAMESLLLNHQLRKALVESGRRRVDRYRAAAFDDNVHRIVAGALGGVSTSGMAHRAQQSELPNARGVAEGVLHT